MRLIVLVQKNIVTSPFSANAFSGEFTWIPLDTAGRSAKILNESLSMISRFSMYFAGVISDFGATITREWTTEDGHLRVAFDIVAGLHHGFLDDAKAVFQKNVAYEIIRAGA